MTPGQRRLSCVLLVIAALQAGCSARPGSQPGQITDLTTQATVGITPFIPVTGNNGPASTISVSTISASTVVMSLPDPTASAPYGNGTATTRPIDPDLLAGERVLCAFHGPVVPDDILQLIRSGKAAGVILFRDNLTTKAHARNNAAAIQLAASQSPHPLPAIIAADQEGGQVKRVDGPPTAAASELGKESTERITQQGTATGVNLLLWGINVDLAPVADVSRANGFEVAQHRSFGSDPAHVGAAVSAFVTGLHNGGVAATLKHFPGLGAATTNTDSAPSVLRIDQATLNTVDYTPFAAGIQAGADMIMIASAIYPTLGPLPAVLSPDIINQVLRGQLSFTGVTISDALDTPALKSYGNPDTIAVTAAPAVDLFITSPAQNCTAMQRSISDAITNGNVTLDAAEAASQRIQHLRGTLAATTRQD